MCPGLCDIQFVPPTLFGRVVDGGGIGCSVGTMVRFVIERIRLRGRKEYFATIDSDYPIKNEDDGR